MRLLIIVPIIALCTSGCAVTAVRALAGTRKPDPAEMFQRADENGDGIITRAEFADARNRMFARLDRNGDGYLTKDDAPGRFAGRGGDGSRLTEAMIMFDKDGDNRISRDEFVNGPSMLFDRADTNHDGVVDARELEAFRAAIAARRTQ